MHRYVLRGAAALAVSAVLVGSTAGVGQAMGAPPSTPVVTSSLSSQSIPLGGHAVDTVTVTGTASGGVPTGSVTFWVCGPTANPAPCTSPNVGPVTVGVSYGGGAQATAAVTLNPGSAGWFCFLDRYNGNGSYSPATDNDPATECVDVTSPPPVKTTPFLVTSPGSRTIFAGGEDTDTALVIGTFKGGAPTGTVSFSACGPTAVPAPCTSPNLGPDVLTLGTGGGSWATATDQFNLNDPGWFCLVVQYGGDAHYNATTDNSTNECVHVLPPPPPKSTPTLTTSLSAQSIPVGGRAIDTATVTGDGSSGPPTGSVTFAACGPTATPTPCTSPNIGPLGVGLSATGSNQSIARVAITAGAPGWYCFLDRYNGDAHYTSATDNDTTTECLDVTFTHGATRDTVHRTAASSLSAVQVGVRRSH
jgi:hypothetical protein